MSRRGSVLPSPSPDDPSVTSPEQRWQALFGTVAPVQLPTLVAQAVAWREQALIKGDVSPQIARDLKVAAADALRRRAARSSEEQEKEAAAATVSDLDAGSDGMAARAGPKRQNRASRTRATGNNAPLPPASSQLLPGTRLVKAHGGINHVVEVETDGFRYQGKLFGSLSAVAKHITGTHWNGLLFFGLRKRGTYPAKARRHG